MEFPNASKRRNHRSISFRFLHLLPTGYWDSPIVFYADADLCEHVLNYALSYWALSIEA